MSYTSDFIIVLPLASHHGHFLFLNIKKSFILHMDGFILAVAKK